ncbi:hypothetical protein [Salmonirosea aquatica]|uniref:hypothetical protein n=1 Tax=Salmonirosea aquatica TaxID=2654236 RepID=UPI003570D6C2
MIGQRETLGAQQQSRPNAGYLTHVYLIATSGVAFVLSPGADLVLPAPGIGLVPGPW